MGKHINEEILYNRELNMESKCRCSITAIGYGKDFEDKKMA